MSAIKQLFASKSHGLFIPYLMAGDPSLEKSEKIIAQTAAMGADIIELGLPFSDPTMDGPVIEQAGARAITANVKTADVLAMVQRLREQKITTPIVLMAYANSVFYHGVSAFATQAKAAGVDALLLVDIAPEEEPDICHAIKQAGLDIILLVSPDTTPARLKAIATFEPAFYYYVAVKGQTGARAEANTNLAQGMDYLRQHLPSDAKICVGFGLSSAEQVGAVINQHGADGAIVGSKLIDVLHTQGEAAYVELLADMIKAAHHA